MRWSYETRIHILYQKVSCNEVKILAIPLLTLTPPVGKNWGKLAEISDFAGAGDRSRDLSHSGQVSEPLHYGDGLANPMNLLTIYRSVCSQNCLPI